MNALDTLLSAPSEQLARLGVLFPEHGDTPSRNTEAAPNSFDNRPSWDNWSKWR